MAIFCYLAEFSPDLNSGTLEQVEQLPLILPMSKTPCNDSFGK